jgi:hypothetical protein
MGLEEMAKDEDVDPEKEIIGDIAPGVARLALSIFLNFGYNGLW